MIVRNFIEGKGENGVSVRFPCPIGKLICYAAAILSPFSMSSKAGSIIGWICVILVAAYNLFAAGMKVFAPVAPGSEAEVFQERLGITGMTTQLGILEFIIVVLYVIPRTSTVGFVLMVGYTAGILANNLTHGLTHAEVLPVYITLVVITIGAWFRNPELTARVRGMPVVA